MTDHQKRPGRHRTKIITAATVGLLASTTLALQACGVPVVPEHRPAPHPDHSSVVRTSTPIKHVVVIFGENISFDHYFGTYPHATNADGTPFHAKPGTPRVDGLLTRVKGGGTLLTDNPNGANPQRLSASDPNGILTCDQNHDYTPEQAAYDGGRMDAFLNNVGNASGKSPTGKACRATDDLDYYDGNAVTALWNYAQQYAMSDSAYSDVFGPSTPGAVSVVAGSTGGFDRAAGSVKYATSPQNAAEAQLVADGRGRYSMISDADPYYDDCGAGALVGESGTGHTVGDLLNRKGLSWGWFERGFAPTTGYSGPSQKGRAYDPTAVTGRAVCGATSNVGKAIGGTGQYGTKADYIPHHEPFQYYASTANPHHLAPTSLADVGTDSQHYTAGKPDFDTANHQYDMSTFDRLVSAITAGRLSADHLPAVSYLKAPGYQDGHAGYSDPLDEQQFIAKEVNALQKSPDWNSTAIVLAYDDSDGWYDHRSATINNPSSTAADVLNGQNQCRTGKIAGHTSEAHTSEQGRTVRPLAGEQGRCGPGPRQPLVIISPYARANFVAHNQTEQGSIVKFIEDNWRLGRIPGSTDAIAGSVDPMFEFRSHHRNRKLILDPITGAKVHDSGH
ncbi:phospholipase C [Microlunatus sp. Gsoil 973]|uniref:phospholipase C n=1 Tax=Microlunatus sp. Gsoil 973 TaxID=2672569 RepID=UPI0018A7EFB7|nr:alkaline phosphatase family protein [Microlunatus sp. Gsoil 973]